jgi:sugar O-acyltransferase (sialic acid O-acetyltransferase NeuD family)
MTKPTPVLIPLLNPNEPEAVLAGLHVREGQWIEPGDILCTLETTKSAAEVQAEAQGYILGLQAEPGQTLTAGETLCYLSDSPDAEIPIEVSRSAKAADPQGSTSMDHPVGLRITQPALALANQIGIDLTSLPVGPLITEKALRELQNASQTRQAASKAEFSPTDLVIYGAGGHGKSLVDLIRSMGTYRIIGFIDDGLAAQLNPPPVMGLPVLGSSEALETLYQQGVRLAVNAVGGIGSLGVRIKVFERLRQAGFACPNVIHPRAVIEPSASLEGGGQIFALAYVGSEAKLGYGAIINTGAIISHECSLGNYVNISPGAILAGQVTVGDDALIGMGVTVNLQVKIGAGARIGNGAVVKADVPENGIVRAGSTWPV